MSLFRRFSRDNRGNVAIAFAVAAVPLVGVGGAAIDYGRATHLRHKLQTAADAAALSSVTMKAQSREHRNKQGQLVFQANLPPGVSVTATVDASSKESTVNASGTIKTSLMQVMQIPSIAVGVHSKAVRIKEGPPPCVLALSKTASPAIDIQGNGNLEALGCVLYSNSSASSALRIGGSSTVKADGYCAVGTVNATPGLTPAPENDCEEMKDPLANLPAPADTECKTNTKNVAVGPKENKTLHPGVYCGGVDLKGDVTFKAGLYVIKDGELKMNSSGTITGEGVTFYLTGTNAGFTINGGAKLELTPMTEGDYKGLVIVQDRFSNVGGTGVINGNADMTLKGAIYAPTQRVRINGTGAAGQASPFLPVIADTVEISGNSTTRIDARDVALGVPLPKSASGAKLVN